MDTIKTFLKHILTGVDNQSYDIGRVLWIIGVISFIFFAGVSVFYSSNHTFDYMAYGTGLGLVLAGGGAGIGAKAKTEPQPEPRKENESN